ncbi:XdhC family protein [Leptolyngbya sp. FACHB-541]|uniref:XdhC family protein n=1 Tax=Leptolyngbya sp. FACHB-541 TaxID=2692810 RepID=UPI001685F063|nr:XdhC/CoxI family protein [Leptolyngbya sp. FACHB-541]MBD1997674.1 XdhC family protein [Leptolyngbya sp. FACHB-541]
MKELQDIVAGLEHIQSSGKTAAIATVVKVEGSAYRRSGARMLMTEEGQRFGSISGGCLEDDVFEHAQAVMRSYQPHLVSYDTTSRDDLTWGLGLGCNGIIQILIEPLTPIETIRYQTILSEWLHRQQPGVLVTLLRTDGRVKTQLGSCLVLEPNHISINTIHDPELSEAICRDAKAALSSNQSRGATYQLSVGQAEVLLEVMQPPVSLMLFGAGQDIPPVIRFAKELGWQVTVCDHRPAYMTPDRFPLADRIITARPEHIHNHLHFHKHTAAVIMTHHYLHDLELLKALLPSSVSYLGMLGSRQRTDRLLVELRTQDIQLTEAQLQRFYAPVGLDIGAETPEAIALSIVSEIQAALTNRSGNFLRAGKGRIHGNLHDHNEEQKCLLSVS